MTALRLLHVLSGLAAVVAGWAIVGLRKGDPRHRRLGWAYVGCMLVSLAAILAQGLRRPTPFHGYAALVASGLVAAASLALVLAQAR